MVNLPLFGLGQILNTTTQRLKRYAAVKDFFGRVDVGAKEYFAYPTIYKRWQRHSCASAWTSLQRIDRYRFQTCSFGYQIIFFQIHYVESCLRAGFFVLSRLSHCKKIQLLKLADVCGGKCLPTSRKCLPTSRECLSTSRKCLPTSRECLSTSRECLSTSRECLPTSRECLSTSLQLYFGG